MSSEPTIALGSGSGETADRRSTITREGILARLNVPSLLLLNVMPKETFEDGHIPRSINLPLSEIEARARNLFPDPSRELLVYCGGPT
jgi:rhodanese-related sulfurtransferase